VSKIGVRCAWCAAAIIARTRRRRGPVVQQRDWPPPRKGTRVVDWHATYTPTTGDRRTPFPLWD
jgi:hypothetical protein